MLISVIIPVYNDEKYLSKCLFSIANQSYNNIEAIVVDDGSTDNSVQICDYFKQIDKRFKVIHKLNSGVSDSRNIGLDVATGDYICFVDSDDWIEKDYFELIVPILSSRKYSIVFNSLTKDDFSYFGKSKDFSKIIKNSFEMSMQDTLLNLFNATFIHWGVVATFFKLDCIKKIRFNKNICFGEDLDFKYNSIINNKLFYYSVVNKYHYVCRKDSSVMSYSILKRCDDLRVLSLILQKGNGNLNNILFFRQYMPRLLGYALIGLSSSDSREYVKGIECMNEARKYIRETLFASEASFVTKLKMLTVIFPFMTKYFSKCYCFFKRIL